jgi:hypothetical protein
MGCRMRKGFYIDCRVLFLAKGCRYVTGLRRFGIGGMQSSRQASSQKLYKYAVVRKKNIQTERKIMLLTSIVIPFPI